MDQDLKDYLQGLEQRLNERLSERLTALAEHFDERIHHTETRLLRAFSDWHSGMDARVTGVEQSDARMLERLAALESRVLRIETEPRH